MPTIDASRLTRKYQATIPAEVRCVLRLKQGDADVPLTDVDRAGLRFATGAPWVAPCTERSFADPGATYGIAASTAPAVSKSSANSTMRPPSKR